MSGALGKDREISFHVACSESPWTCENGLHGHSKFRTRSGTRVLLVGGWASDPSDGAAAAGPSPSACSRQGLDRVENRSCELLGLPRSIDTLSQLETRLTDDIRSTECSFATIDNIRWRAHYFYLIILSIGKQHHGLGYQREVIECCTERQCSARQKTSHAYQVTAVTGDSR